MAKKSKRKKYTIRKTAQTPPMYSYAGAIGSGALSGATTGAYFGPWGALIGGVVGGGVAAFQEADIQKQNKDTLALQQQNLVNEQTMYNQMQRPAYAKMGGFVDKKVINIEKGELEINPSNFNVIRDYKLRPPHPKDPNMMDMGGNVEADPNNFIIPRKYREEYLRATKFNDGVKQEALVHNIQVEKDAKKAVEDAKMMRKMKHGGPVDPNGPNDPQSKMMRRFIKKLGKQGWGMGMTPMFNNGGPMMGFHKMADGTMMADTEMYGKGGQLYPYNVQAGKSKISIENGRVGPKNKRLGKYAKYGIPKGMKGHVGAEFRYPGGKRAFRFEHGASIGETNFIRYDEMGNPIMANEEFAPFTVPELSPEQTGMEGMTLTGSPFGQAKVNIPGNNLASTPALGNTYDGRFDAPTDFSKIAGVGNKFATASPYLFDLARGAFDTAFQYDADKYKQKNRISYRDVNFKPIERAIDQQGDIASANAASAAGGNAGLFLSNEAQNRANVATTKADAMMKAEQYNLSNRYNVDVANLGIDRANKNLEFQIEQMNQANKSKRQEAIGKGLEGLSGLTQQRMYEKNQMGRDTDYLALFKQLYPTLGQFKG